MGTRKRGRTRKAHTHKTKFRTFNQLSPEEQNRAIGIATSKLLETICQGLIEFGDDFKLPDKLKAAWDNMGQPHAPWTIGKHIMETFKEEIESMGRDNAKDSLYPDAGIKIIWLTR